MKIKFIILALLSFRVLSVDAQEKSNNSPVQQGSFKQSDKRFNDWAISLGGGVPLLQSADLTSIKNGNGANLFGYSAYISIDKAITHAFGLNLQYDMGQTQQGYAYVKEGTVLSGNAGKTKYQAISLLGDINFSNLLRRPDNQSTYRWAFHGYAGMGTVAFEAYRQDKGAMTAPLATKQNFSFASIFTQAGAGLKFNVNKRLDLETRLMYVISGSDSFDGGGDPNSTLNAKEEQVSDNMFNATLGISLKLGKHQSHLMWHDPLQEIYYKLDVLENNNTDVIVCKHGDQDNDGVCDDWDRQTNTPTGARVDGSGVALDADLDGVIDLYDKCVTVAGPVENQGCPAKSSQVDRNKMATDIEMALKQILFDLNKSTLRTESAPKLDLAADLIKSSQGKTYLLIGHTDKKGSDAYNLALSRARAAEVMRELEKRGVNPSQLKSRGVGEAEAKAAETASDEERQADRKIEVKYVVDAEWDSLPKNDLTTKKVIKRK